MDNEDINIELRSEKVRNIVGKIPPALMRYGIAIIGIVLIVIFIISLIIPYRETVDLSIKICSEPESEAIKAKYNSKIIADTTIANVKANSIIAYEQIYNKIYPIFSHKGGNIAVSAKNGQIVEEGEVIFIIIPTENYKIYGTANITEDEADKIKTGQVVNINIDTTNVIGIISDIHKLPIATEQHNYRIKIDFEETADIYTQSTAKGIVTISEKSFFRKIFK
jgi:hypothetical protein